MIANYCHILLVFLFSLGTRDYPVPEKGSNHLFYIQRTANTNTIVYEANFDKQGNLYTIEPVNAFWIDYENNGKESKLTAMERRFAYGVKHKLHDPNLQEFELKLAAYDKLKLKLIWLAPFKASVFVNHQGKDLKLDHAFITATNNGLLSKVESIKVYLNSTVSALLVEKEVYKKN